MDVLAYLPPPLLSHLRIVVGRELAVRPVDDLPSLEEAVRRLPVDVLVLDPTLGTGPGELAELLARFPTLPVIAYTRLSPAAMQAVAELSRRAPPLVVLHRYDDEPRRFRELLERQSARVLTETMLDLLEPALAQLPARLASAVERLFRHPHAFFTAHDLARAAGLTVRTVYRQCDTAGLASPRLLVVGARLLRAYQYLREPVHSIEDIAAKLGYSAPRMFTRHARLALGVTPRELRQTLGPNEVLDRLERVMLPGAPPRRRLDAADD